MSHVYQKMFMSLFMLFALTTLTGCAQTFVSPVHGPTAKLSVRYPAAASVAVFDDPIECTGGPHPLYPLFVKENQRFVTIPANKPLTLLVTTPGNTDIMPADSRITFIPEAGKKYTVESSHVGRSPWTYRLRILDVVTLANGHSAYSSVRFIKRKGGFFATCTDNEMKESIKKISTSYQKN